MQVVLVMIRSNGETRSFSLSKDVTILGRSHDCDLRLALSEISRRHARLIKQGEELLLEDLGSANGTTVNGQAIQQRRLAAGDKLQLGPVTFIIEIESDSVASDNAGNTADATGSQRDPPAPAEIEGQIQDTDEGPKTSTDPDPFSLDDSLPPSP
jgi:pSer/pThr/pTyr-binding forkhead associated (FHA) protein